MLFEFSLSGLIETVKERLRYISGKRTDHSDLYFRHIACKDDEMMLLSLAEETFALISMRLGHFSGSYTIGTDSVTFSVKGYDSSGSFSFEKEMKTTMRELIIEGIIYRWFLITGFEDAQQWNERMENSLEIFTDKLHIFSGLPLRKTSPF